MCSCFSRTHTCHLKVLGSIANASGFTALLFRVAVTLVCSLREATRFLWSRRSFRALPHLRCTEGDSWGARRRNRSLASFDYWAELDRRTASQTCRQTDEEMFLALGATLGCYPKAPTRSSAVSLQNSFRGSDNAGAESSKGQPPVLVCNSVSILC